jgi:hypothetical protein
MSIDTMFHPNDVRALPLQEPGADLIPGAKAARILRDLFVWVGIPATIIVGTFTYRAAIDFKLTSRQAVWLTVLLSLPPGVITIAGGTLFQKSAKDQKKIIEEQQSKLKVAKDIINDSEKTFEAHFKLALEAVPVSPTSTPLTHRVWNDVKKMAAHLDRFPESIRNFRDAGNTSTAEAAATVVLNMWMHTQAMVESLQASGRLEVCLRGINPRATDLKDRLGHLGDFFAVHKDSFRALERWLTDGDVPKQGKRPAVEAFYGNIDDSTTADNCLLFP